MKRPVIPVVGLLKLLMLLLAVIPLPLAAANVTVSSLSALQTAINNAGPGDVITITNGVYTATAAITVSRQGTASQPITITAQTIGGVEIGGTSGFQINSPAAYIIIKGFKFTHSTGTIRIATGATHCLFTRNIFECVAAGTGNKPYISVSGDDNVISYNTFQHKSTEGCMITIQGPGSSGMAQRTWIHHNYFNDFAPSGANNSSAIQVGLSSRSLTSAFTIIEYNLFIDCRGENEGIVANKSSDNIYRYNTFGTGSSEVSLRHGDRMKVYGNFFIGCTGLRFCADDHQIYSNYFEDCDFAINCVNGDGDVHNGDALTSHDRPDGVNIVFNTLVNNTTNYRMPGRTNGLGATNITFANNIIQGGDAVSLSGTYSNPVWGGNILWNVTGGAGAIPSGGYTIANPQLSEDGNSVFHIAAGSPAVNTATGTYSYVTLDIDGQTRDSSRDAGSDEYSTTAVTNRPLTTADVGVTAGSVSPACEPVTGSTDDGNVPSNVLDGDLNTRWSASGDGQWLLFCLGEGAVTVTSVDIAFYNGDQRQAFFDIQVSSNGSTFTTVAANRQSSGSSLQLENFPITPQQTRYVRLLGHGNNVSAWNSYTEVRINSEALAGTTESVSASVSYPNPGNSQVTVRYEVKEAGPVIISLHNSTSGHITTLVNENKEAGSYQHIFDVDQLPCGIHVFRIFHDGKTSLHKWIKQ